MEFVETILRSSNAEKYIDTFRKNKILDSFAVKALKREDLEILIDDKEIVENLSKVIENLQIPSE